MLRLCVALVVVLCVESRSLAANKTLIPSRSPTAFPTQIPTELSKAFNDVMESNVKKANDGTVAAYGGLLLILTALAFSCMYYLQRFCFSYPVLVPIFETPTWSKWIAGWVPELYKQSDEDVYQAGGLDAIAFLRFQILCLKFFPAIFVLAAVVLLPFYVGDGSRNVASASKLNGVFTLANMPFKDNSTMIDGKLSVRNQAGFILVSIVTLSFYIILWKLLEYEYIAYNRWRRRYRTQ